jgi:ADP-heptose:LPS heptosyltransferase
VIEHEYYESHPEIRKDITYTLECQDYATWLSWRELYKALPNVKVVIKPPQNVGDFRTNARKQGKS